MRIKYVLSTVNGCSANVKAIELHFNWQRCCTYKVQLTKVFLIFVKPIK